ncbi:MAG: Rossmann-like domain-containing protein [Anaerolineae bacterium]
MQVLEDLLASLPEEHTPPKDVCVGAFWTVVWGRRGCGLASTQREGEAAHGEVLVRWGGRLLEHSTTELAGLVRSSSLTEAALGMAAVNALIPVDLSRCSEENAAEVLARQGEGKHVVIVGHFPFVERLRQRVGHLAVLELRPRPGDLEAARAADILPQADVIGLTGTVLLNRTFDALRRLWRPGAYVVMLGPTTPLSPVLFDYGVDLLAGTYVTDPPVALRHAAEGCIFRQMRGVRLLTLDKGG